jgi:hypothetical protein
MFPGGAVGMRFAVWSKRRKEVCSGRQKDIPMSYDVDTKLATVLGDALTRTMNEWGVQHGLRPLSWRMVPFAESPSLEGRPLDDEIGAELVTQQWAESLDMTPNAYPLRPGVLTWFVDLDGWYLEISSDPLFFGE